MSCPDADRVLDYLARRLAATDRDAVDAHLDACPDCRVLLAELARTTAVDELVPRDAAAEPERVGRYRIDERLGEGGMGAVYVAYDPELDRKVALKLIHPELAIGTGADRMIREGRALAKLSHPNVVAVYDAGTDGDRVYVAMELVDGDNLVAWLRRAPRGWREIVARFVEVGRGLAAAHAAGVVHRDVKPENVLVDRGGRARVVDFGLAGAIGDPAGAPAATGSPEPATSNRLTQPGALLGTPAFMSPEQRRRDPVGPETDQYSLCAALASALAAGDHPSPRARRAPGWLRRVIARGMATDPAARFASIGALVTALDPVPRARRTRALAIGVVATGVLATTAAVAYSIRNPASLAEVACDAAGDPHAGWSNRERTVVSDAIRDAGAPIELWERVDGAVGAYLDDLAAAKASLCAIRAQTPELRANLADGLDCLAGRRGDLAEVVTRLGAIEPDTASSAVAAVHELARPEDCANPAALAAERRLRHQPDGRRTRDALTGAVNQAIAATEDGDYRGAVEHARRAVELARPIGGFFLSRSLIVLGDSVSSTDGFAAAEPLYREAATIAEADHHDQLRASAMASLFAMIAREPGREREALTMRPLVDAAIARAELTAEFQPMLEQGTGVAQLRLGDLDAAIAALTASVAAARTQLPRTDPRMPEFLYPLAIALGMVGRDTEAQALLDESVAIATAIWGADAPQTARYTIPAASAHARLGDCGRAVTELTAARAVLAGALPADSPEHLSITETIGSCELLLGKPDDALREHRARHQVLEAAGRGRSVEFAAAWVDIGDAHLAQHAVAEARADFTRAIELYQDLVGTSDARLGLPLTRLGEAELARARPALAIAPLERAVAVLSAPGSPATMLADAEFPLARALAATGGDRDRARALATHALAAYTAGSTFYAARARAVAAWLTAPSR